MRALYRAIPIYVWILVFMGFISGYFIGGVVQSFAIQKNMQDTANYMRSR